MSTFTSRARLRLTTIVATATVVAACAPEASVAPETEAPTSMHVARLRGTDAEPRALAVLRRATARYHSLKAATDDGFVFLHGCETRPDEGPVGMVYVHPGRLDAVIDPALPEALVYEPGRNGRARLVGVELAVPYAAWTNAQPPQFLGASFQPEDEFGVWGLHVWLWRQNPEGLFAESNPRVACAAE
jgi:hypothetical protein